ncbi:hypothetical protein [Thermoproteus sp. CP80]|uniref:hypothetical protein n=1 Tax=Thermoproteus sp. CP80 TaxID=1650659 RepID=UPI00117D407E|nr:hypothetical protein [Thermoproteus sp. CP80]
MCSGKPNVTTDLTPRRLAYSATATPVPPVSVTASRALALTSGASSADLNGPKTSGRWRAASLNLLSTYSSPWTGE